MRRRRERMHARELPDAKIVPFPDNWRGDDSPAAHRASWGPNHDMPPLRAGEVTLVNRGKLLAVFTLYVPLGRGLGFYIRGCRLIQWGPGERVFLPQHATRVKEIAAADDGEFAVIRDRTYYAELLWFDTNRGQKAFEEAALRAARYAVDRRLSDQCEPSAAFVDDGAADANDVPF